MTMKIKEKISTEDLRGMVFDIARCSFHDGPGIRTTVFLKGCPLNCWWCHNPESKKGQPEEFRNLNTGEIRVKGRKMTVDEVMEIVLKDKTYYEESGGGLTISGGEPFSQSDFVYALAEKAGKAGIHVAVETSGCVGWDKIAESLPFIDLYLYDYKHSDSKQLEKYTKGSYTLIENNFNKLIELNKVVIRRCPIIPTVNDTLAHIKSICAMSLNYPLTKMEILLYHTLGISKSKSIGKEYLLPGIKSLNNEEEEKRVRKMIAQFPHSNIYLNNKLC